VFAARPVVFAATASVNMAPTSIQPVTAVPKTVSRYPAPTAPSATAPSVTTETVPTARPRTFSGITRTRNKVSATFTTVPIAPTPNQAAPTTSGSELSEMGSTSTVHPHSAPI
jgi:hypothetical protein